MRQLFFLLCFLLQFSLFGGYSLVGGKWSPEPFVPTLSVQDHYDKGLQALNRDNYEEAFSNFLIICYHFQESPFYPDALFYSGLCYFSKGELDLANKQFNEYLSLTGKLKHFERVFDLKFEIAESYRHGKKKHLFGNIRFPKWVPARGDSLSLYEEIIATLPGQDIAAKALFSKSKLLCKRRGYKEAIDSLKVLQRLYPKHELAAESYVKISKIFIKQSILESQNPDLIALAQLNLSRYCKAFPTDERLEIVEKNILSMKEIYATSLYETGRFYERKKKPAACVIYYQDALARYPETAAAEKSIKRLKSLGVDYPSLVGRNL